MVKREVISGMIAVAIWAVSPFLGLVGGRVAVSWEDTPASSHVGRATWRLNRENLEIRVYQGRRRLELPYFFVELAVMTPDAHIADLKTLVGRSVALTRSDKHEEEWDIYENVWVGGELPLADNIFIVKDAFVSSHKFPIEIRRGKKLRLLEPGEALLILK